MRRTIRAIDTGLASARRNISVTAALAEMHGAGQIADTFRFHVYPRSVLIGHHQNFDQAVAADYCARSGIEIARRVTGGGAVYMSPGVLAWDMVVDRSRFAARLPDLMEMICGGLAAGLSQLGLPARFQPLNAIEISGRKIAGSSGVFIGSTVLAQGTILIDIDMTEMEQALVLPANGQGADDGKLPAARVSSLAACLGHVPAFDQVKRLLIAGLAQTTQLRFEPGILAEVEKAFALRLHESEYGRDDFVRDTVHEIDAAHLSLPHALRDADVHWPASQ